MPKFSGKLSKPSTLQGNPAVGRIAVLWVGQGHGIIRTAQNRQIFFHRGDMDERTPFNELQVGDTVVFELLDDKVSGARALRVTRRPVGDVL